MLTEIRGCAQADRRIIIQIPKDLKGKPPTNRGSSHQHRRIPADLRWMPDYVSGFARGKESQRITAIAQALYVVRSVWARERKNAGGSPADPPDHPGSTRVIRPLLRIASGFARGKESHRITAIAQALHVLRSVWARERKNAGGSLPKSPGSPRIHQGDPPTFADHPILSDTSLRSIVFYK